MGCLGGSKGTRFEPYESAGGKKGRQFTVTPLVHNLSPLRNRHRTPHFD